WCGGGLGRRGTRDDQRRAHEASHGRTLDHFLRAVDAVLRARTRRTRDRLRPPCDRDEQPVQAAVLENMNRLRSALPCLVIAWLSAPGAAAADAPTSCTGDYAEDLSVLSPEARTIEAATPSYSYAVRTSATYECVSYG